MPPAAVPVDFLMRDTQAERGGQPVCQVEIIA
jgi:hypothetical protein